MNSCEANEEREEIWPAIALFAKAPQLGRVKTRLAATIGDEAAIELHLAFVDDSLSRLRDVSIKMLKPYLYLASEWNASAYPLPESAKGVEIRYQSKGDLGDRMKSAIEELYKLGHSSAMIVGTDSPNLPRKIITDAIDALKRFDCVLGPAEDGGYYLIGIRREVRSKVSLLFDDMEWSNEKVFSKTMERADAAQMSVCFLPLWFDVDKASDLARLKREIEEGTADRNECPSTAALLAVREYAGII